MINKVPRCILTGHKNGKSTITSDERACNVVEHLPDLIISDVWATNTMPVDVNQQVSTENTLFPKTPPQGTYLRYVHIPPDATLNHDLLLKKFDQQARHPLMHQTDTLDYIVILSGEIILILEKAETLVQTGDIVIQRATNHAWSNRSQKACMMLAVLVDAKIINRPIQH